MAKVKVYKCEYCGLGQLRDRDADPMNCKGCGKFMVLETDCVMGRSRISAKIFDELRKDDKESSSSATVVAGEGAHCLEKPLHASATLEVCNPEGGVSRWCLKSSRVLEDGSIEQELERVDEAARRPNPQSVALGRGMRRRAYAGYFVLSIFFYYGAQSRESGMAAFSGFWIAKSLLCWMRYLNIGFKPEYSLLGLIPVVGLWVELRCLILPEGYAYSKTLDKKGKIAGIAGAIIGGVILVGIVILIIADI